MHYYKQLPPFWVHMTTQKQIRSEQKSEVEKKRNRLIKIHLPTQAINQFNMHVNFHHQYKLI